MPAPRAKDLQDLARQKFMSFKIRVPTNWKEPQGDPDAQHYRDAFKESEKNTTPGSPALFIAATNNKYHTDTQKMLISEYGSYIDKMCECIAQAWGEWQMTATFVGIVVTGSLANGGQLMGPPLTPLIMAHALTKGLLSSPMKALYTTAIATIIGTQWLAYTATMKMVAVNMWPMFNSFPSPVVPPTPCVPTQFTKLVHLPMVVSMNVMKPLIVAMHANPLAPFSAELFESICHAFEQTVDSWTKNTKVTNVLGIGAVPTCVPPVMAPGPVVGTAIMPPGGLV